MLQLIVRCVCKLRKFLPQFEHALYNVGLISRLSLYSERVKLLKKVSIHILINLQKVTIVLMQTTKKTERNTLCVQF